MNESAILIQGAINPLPRFPHGGAALPIATSPFSAPIERSYPDSRRAAAQKKLPPGDQPPPNPTTRARIPQRLTG